MIKKITSKSIFKFLIIGGCSTLIDYLFYSLMMKRVHVLVAKTFSMIIASIFSYLMNKKWTFKYEEKTNIRIIVRFYFVALINISVNTIVNWCVLSISNSKNLAFIIATGIAMCVNYILQRVFVFSKDDKIKKEHRI